MNTEEVIDRVVETAVLHHGDILVVTLPYAMDRKQIDAFADEVKSKIGDAVRVLVIGGALQLHVLRPDEAAE